VADGENQRHWGDGYAAPADVLDELHLLDAQNWVICVRKPAKWAPLSTARNRHRSGGARAPTNHPWCSPCVTHSLSATTPASVRADALVARDSPVRPMVRVEASTSQRKELARRRLLAPFWPTSRSATARICGSDRDSDGTVRGGNHAARHARRTCPILGADWEQRGSVRRPQTR